MTRQLGPALAVERLWRETGCGQVIDALAGEREFQFDVERAVFLTVYCIGCSTPAPTAPPRSGAMVWSSTASPISICNLHLYRAMGWLGEELADQSGRGIGPRTTKDLVERAAVRRAQQPVQRTEPGFSRHHLALF